ncbi:hypothetical protein DFJ77DRAFT_474037 [Powellomyces hirtus]|nr:hypothetical protein DFJ77DRAFT_474037 [Powellomyces hirtus]
METHSRTQSSTGSQPQRIRDYAPSSVVSSVSSSWDAVEHDYDAKATAQVQEMLEHLETFLYHESRGLEGNRELLEECEEWSSLFPHLRIRGHQLMPTGDIGYEAISRSELRSHSPYFFIPESPAEDKSSHVLQSAHQHIPSVEGIGLGSDIIGKKPKTYQNDRERHHDINIQDTSLIAQSVFDWSHKKTEEALTAISDVNIQSPASRWHLFRYQAAPQDCAEAAEPDEEEDRCPTPTPDNPYPQPVRPTSMKKYAVEAIAAGNGEFDAMRKHLGTLTKDGDGSRYFALIKQRRSKRSSVSVSKNGSVDWVVSFVSWMSEKEGKSTALDTADTRTSSFPDRRPSVDESAMPVLTVYDVLPMLQGIDCVIQEYVSPSLESLWLITEEQLNASMCVIDDGQMSWLNDNMEEVFAIDGEVEEWFACDNQTIEDAEDDKKIKHHSHRRRALPPVTPNASIRQDIVGHLFDDIWSEMIPVFHPLLKSLSSDMSSDDDDEDSILIGDHGKLAFDEILLRQFGDGGDGLLSAMTIRPVSLQKRESSARIRSTLDANGIPSNMPSMFEVYPSSRPTSARPTSARPTSARPTSGRNMDMHGHPAHQNHPSRMQTAASNKASSYNWKRSNPGMRLLPLPAVPGPGNMTALSNGLNDMIYGTSIGIGSMKTPISHAWENSRPSTSIPGSNSTTKRLPPIRGIVANPHEQAAEAAGKVARHVFFDAPEPADSPLQRTRAASPRPFSARRQPSAGLRRTRPHTAMVIDETKHPISSNTGTTTRTASKPIARNIHNHVNAISNYVEERDRDHTINPVMGMRMRQGVKSAIGRRKPMANAY